MSLYFDMATSPEGPKIDKIQSRDARLTKASFENGMKLAVENGYFNPAPLWLQKNKALSSENDSSNQNLNFQARMFRSLRHDNKISRQ